MALIWIALSILAGALAHNKGRSGLGFFILSLLLSTIVGLIAAAIVRSDRTELEQRSLARAEAKKCPYCAEIVKVEAVVCRYCGRELPVEVNVTTPPSNVSEPPTKTWVNYIWIVAILFVALVAAWQSFKKP